MPPGSADPRQKEWHRRVVAGEGENRISVLDVGKIVDEYFRGHLGGQDENWIGEGLELFLYDPSLRFEKTHLRVDNGQTNPQRLVRLHICISS
jgi:hypothetical protein